MILSLIRETYTAQTTIGKLYIDDKYFCYTLEDTVRAPGIKVKGETAIPEGDYEVIVTMSGRFKRMMPLILSKGKSGISNGGISFSGVRFHGGNKHADTHGCPLVAKNKLNNNTIQGTMEKPLTATLEEAIRNGDKIYLNVINKSQDN
jgi:hypothetical protein|tara:strand:- start:66 stop:509 length:444 start_codon:yes stop_codon:yes gene_type:complete